jgi:hypothetical protein
LASRKISYKSDLICSRSARSRPRPSARRWTAPQS